MKKLFLTLVLVCVYFCACEDGGDITEETGNTLKINLAKQNVDAEFEPAEYSVAVTSPYSWEAIAKNDWITIITKTGIAGNEVLRFSVQYNKGDERKGTITLKNTDYNLIAELYVTQKPFTPIIDYTKSLNFTNDGGEQTLAVTANFEYDVTSNAKWLSVQKSTDGVKVVAAKHTGTEPRTAEVTISNEQYSISEVARVQQGAFTPELLISPSALTFEAEGGTQEVAITSNIEYTCTTNADWLWWETTSSGIAVSVSANQSTQQRTATISISNKEYGLSKNISVSQRGITKESTNVISYTTSDNRIISFKTSDSVFGASIISHTYENGQGLIIFNAPVTSIGDAAFRSCWTLTSITIPKSVTEIGREAFKYCDNLKSVTIPDSVTSIGECAFEKCYRLKEFKGKFASADSRSLIVNDVLVSFAPAELTQYTIPNGVTSIGSYAFSQCSKLTSITIPTCVTSIGSYAFSQCSKLTSITIPNCVTSIGSYAFSQCSKLTSITIPNCVTSIGSYAFSECSSLPSITIPSSVTSIGHAAFKGCTGELIINSKIVQTSNYYDSPIDTWLCDSKFTKLTIGANISTIGRNAFYNCETLTSITIPNSVVSIESSAFAYCTNLTSITIPSSVTWIGDYAFSGCTGELIINSKMVEKSYYGEGSASNPGPNRLWSEGARFSKLSIGENITKIGTSRFNDWSYLSQVTIPSSITEIGVKAFEGCDCSRVDISDLSAWCKIDFGDKYSNPLSGAKLYLNNKEVTNLVIPSDITQIKPYAFCGFDPTTVTIHNRVTSIGEHAFYGCDCSRVNISDLSAWCKIDFSDKYSNPLSGYGYPKLYLNNSAVTDLVIPSDINKIKNYTFQWCGSITCVTIHENITSIGKNAFFRCCNLMYIYCKPTTPPAVHYYRHVYYDSSEPSPIEICEESFPFNSGMVIYVPRSAYDLYKQYKFDGSSNGYISQLNWAKFGAYIEPYDF